MRQSYAAICLISTRKVPRHGLDFRVTASLKSQWKRPFTSPTLKKNPLPLQLSRLLPVATDDDGDRRRRRRPTTATDDDGDRRRRRPDATESTGSLRLRCHPQVSALSIASCQLELRPSIHRQLLSSPPVIDVDRDWLWGDGLAASSPVGLCRKFQPREDSQKARLERKRAAVEHRDVQHRVSGFVGFRLSATRLSVHPLQLRGSRSLPKSRSEL